jgi:hypothetical protein
MLASDAFNILNSVLDDTEGDDDDTAKCLISGLPLDNTRVTFPCSHSFNYVPLVSDVLSYFSLHGRTRLRCPYCRTLVGGVIPYRPDLLRAYRVGVNGPICECFEKHECTVEGCHKNATIPIPDGGTYACSSHYRKLLNPKKKRTRTQPVNSVVSTCTAILKTGQRKGEPCGAKTSTGLCKRHTPSQ